MARTSTKENKNLYHKTRESLQLTREAASELLESITPERIEKIENERSLPHPDEVLVMAEKYKQPVLCNYYCANQCPIGQQYVPEIKAKDLSQIVLETLASLNILNKQKERLIEITVDGKITGDSDPIGQEEYAAYQEHDKEEHSAKKKENIALHNRSSYRNGRADWFEVSCRFRADTVFLCNHKK